MAFESAEKPKQNIKYKVTIGLEDKLPDNVAVLKLEVVRA